LRVLSSATLACQEKTINVEIKRVWVVAAWRQVWMLGSEGTAALGLSQEVGIITITDLVAKLGFGLYFLFNFEDIMGEDSEDGGMNQQSQQYV